MNLNNVVLPKEMEDILSALFTKAKKFNENLNESSFVEFIFASWLEPYLREPKIDTVKRKDVILKNDLENIIKHSGKTQKQICQETGLNTTYLNRIIKGKYVPSITVALLLLDALNYHPCKLKEVFYLEPVQE